MKTQVTIADVIRSLNLSAKNERRWLRSIRNAPKAVAASKAFMAAAKAVEVGDWAEHKAALLTWVTHAELGATAGYTKKDIRNCESMKRYAEFRKLLGLPKRAN